MKDPDRFVKALHGLFDEFPRSPTPRDRRYQPVLDGVEGLARENNLALIGLAASLLEEGESYVEVGTYLGASLISALLGNPRADVVAIDTFEFRDGSRAALEANLERFGFAGRADVLEGDVFELVPAGRLDGRRVGAWYFDALHEHRAQLHGLRIAEPHLAPGALLIVDDSDWESVGRAVNDYLAEQPRARRLVAIDGNDRGQPQWWEGVEVLAWGG